MAVTLSHTLQRTIRAFSDLSRSLTQSTWWYEGEGRGGRGEVTYGELFLKEERGRTEMRERERAHLLVLEVTV